MASYSVNDAAVEHARRLIGARQYVLRSQWGEVQPAAGDENAYLETHDWEEYGRWFLGLTDGELDRLEAAGVIGETPIPVSQRKPRSSALLHAAAAQGTGTGSGRP